MKQKKIFFLTLVLFILIIAGATYAYSKLSSENSADNLSSLRLTNSGNPTEVESETKQETQSQAEAQTETEKETNAQTETQTETEKETNAQTETQTETEEETKTQTETQTATSSKTQSASSPEAKNAQQAQTASPATPSSAETESKENASAADSQYMLAPDFTVTDADGKEIDLFSLLGKPAVLNFWNSNCPPCMMEMPDFQEAYEELGDEITFIMIDTVGAMGETKESGQKYVEEEGFTFPVYYDTSQDAIYTYGITGFPTTFFISKEGYLIAGASGMIDKDTLMRGIDMIR